MKTVKLFQCLGRPAFHGAMIAASAVLCSCMREDEEMQRQLSSLNAQLKEKSAEIEAKTRALEQAQAAAKTQAPAAPASARSGDELTGARARISELEQQLAAARQQPSGDGAAASRKAANLDLEGMKQKLERDLIEKAARLRDLVLQQTGVAKISATTTESIQYPPEVIAPFHSAISFTLPAADGRQCVISFPVEADFSGTWSLPTPADIQKTYKAVREKFSERFAGVPEGTGGSKTAGAAGALAATQTQQGVPKESAEDPFKSGEWHRLPNGDMILRPRGSSSGAPSTSQPAPSAQPAQSTPLPRAAPPSQASQQSLPFPSSSSSIPGAGLSQPQPAGNIPPPIMPVQRDVIIRWK